MGIFRAGQIVVVAFPYSDFSKFKPRPSILLADAGRGDWIACQVTSNPYAATNSIALTGASFSMGNLPHLSYARPAKLNTIHQTKFLSLLGMLTTEALDSVRSAVISAIRAD